MQEMRQAFLPCSEKDVRILWFPQFKGEELFLGKGALGMTGVFGVVGKEDCVKTLFYGTDYHSHLGTEKGGLAVLGENLQRVIRDISHAQFKSKFVDDYKKMNGNSGIGVISDTNSQPIIINSKFGTFAIVTSGLIENIDEVASQLFKDGHSFTEVTETGINPTEVIGKLIILGDNVVDGIEKVFDRIKGSASILLLTEEGIYAARDRYGRTPLVIGEKNGNFAVASETCSFSNLGFKIKKFLGPGEIVLITDNGLKQKKEENRVNQICAFLWIYTGYPASVYEGINVEVVRERCGKFLAKNDDVKADFVSGVPDSGTGHAIGYAMEAGIPFRRCLVKYTPGYGRSYLPPSQDIRNTIATMKLIPVKEIAKGNRIVVCEDSIVRGTQLKNFTVQKLWDNGAKEVHIRPACPPLMYPCKFALSTRSIYELAARKAIKTIEGKDMEDVQEYLDPSSDKYAQMVELIRKELNVTSLKYQTLDDMVKAIGLPKERLCTYCWDGK